MATRNIFLTGASRGIGAVLAMELARRGHRVGCLSRKGEGPESVEVPTELRERLINLKGDVTDTQAIAAALKQFNAEVGRIDGVINNAGLHLEGPAHSQPLADFEEVMRTNATSTFAICQLAYPYLEAGGGLIVNMGSFFEKLGVRRNAAYAASKAATAAITRCLAVEWASKRIRLLTVAPGYIETDLNKDFLASEKIKAFLAARIPVGGPAQAQDVAKLISLLFAEEIGFLTGETLYLDGGQGMAL
ncbi:SDR family oxidoreductase [Pseudomonas synxantha]|uniref:SDR family oxidoreductase n=1 Tax=Pseudomonas synxantha TaxID=47883 RepID=A0ABS0UPG8_9PSED|nr:SDR family oxidoreductase [Pseudomonas synxantha]MBI6567086.1 SDR family oxidoreductase [Pseudomonas synxantha]MBI6583405.1 SDR family oxidoreductase [Pseudomonas synxantha]MBI6643403.1 SDR family oxidoreductase [Pseudomonas synxantha]